MTDDDLDANGANGDAEAPAPSLLLWTLRVLVTVLMAVLLSQADLAPIGPLPPPGSPHVAN